MPPSPKTVVLDLEQEPQPIDAQIDADQLVIKAERAESSAVERALVGLARVKGLRSLRLESRLRALPEALTELRAVQHLTIVDPDLPGLPSTLGRMRQLRTLRLDTLHLASFPKSLGALSNLRELHVDSHHLSHLPDTVRDLDKLQSLSLLLRRVIVSDWEHPAYFKPRFLQPLDALFKLLASLPRLRSLTLGEPPGDGWNPDRVFDPIPGELAELRALETLTFAWCNAIRLPGEIARLPRLREIVAWHSHIDGSPEEFARTFPDVALRCVWDAATPDHARFITFWRPGNRGGP